MRDLKFRYVWKRKSDKKIWIEIIPIECLEHVGDKPFIHKDHRHWELLSRQRYTGLKDKNGKEIYEGDIVEYYERFFTPRQLFIVDFVNGMFYLKSTEDDEYNSNIIIEPLNVIGNIHETPELLK